MGKGKCEENTAKSVWIHVAKGILDKVCFKEERGCLAYMEVGRQFQASQGEKVLSPNRTGHSQMLQDGGEGGIKGHGKGQGGK